MGYNYPCPCFNGESAKSPLWWRHEWLLTSCNFTSHTVYPKKYAHGFCFAVLCCGYTLTDFPISIRLTSLALWQSNDCPSASKATLMNMDKYFMWIHYERLHNHNKAKHNKSVCIFLGIYCRCFMYIDLMPVVRGDIHIGEYIYIYISIDNAQYFITFVKAINH